MAEARQPLTATPSEAKIVRRAVKRALRPISGGGGIRVTENDTGVTISFTRTILKGTGGVGGGAPTPMRIKSIQNDYLTCRTWDGTTDGDTDVLVAKPYSLRHVSANYPWIDTSTLATVNAQEVTVEVAATEYTWRVTVPYSVNEVIWAFPTSLGDVVVSSVPLVWEDTNRNAHAWGEVE